MYIINYDLLSTTLTAGTTKRSHFSGDNLSASPLLPTEEDEVVEL